MRQLKVTQVSQSVFCVQRAEFLSCSYFVLRPDGIVLIDAGMDVDGLDMLEGIRQQGADVKDVRSILITHWHNDHSTGAASIAEASSADVMSHPASVERLARRQKASGFRALLGKALPVRGALGSLRGLLELAPPRAVEVTQCLSEGDRVQGGFRVLETPGHIQDHLSYFYEPEGVLFTGDAIAVAHDRVSFMSRFLTEDVSAAKASMLRCIDLAPEAFCPGHRAPLIGPSKDHLEHMRQKVEKLNWWPVIGCGDA